MVQLRPRQLARARQPADPVDDLPELSWHEVADAVALHAGHLDDLQQAVLVDAITQGRPIKIAYTNATGAASIRVIEPLDLDEHLLTAWCHLRDEERAFALDRVDAVYPG